MCHVLGVAPSGYYAWCRRSESAHAQRDRRLRVLVRASFAASKQPYGSPRIHEDLLEQKEPVSRKRVIRLMQEDGLKARARKRFKCTTMSDHDQPVAANLLDRQFTADAPNRRWVGDTTEFVIGESGKLYLAAILDLFSRFIVGWAVSAVNDRHLTLNALGRALRPAVPQTTARPCFARLPTWCSATVRNGTPGSSTALVAWCARPPNSSSSIPTRSCSARKAPTRSGAT